MNGGEDVIIMAKEVSIYTTPTCVYCKAAKELFDEHGVIYTEYDVSQDQVRAGEMIEKSGQMGVPVIRIMDDEGKEHIVVGFNKPRLKGLLGVQ